MLVSRCCQKDLLVESCETNSYYICSACSYPSDPAPWQYQSREEWLVDNKI
jgi:hypothetical protein